MNLTYSFSVFVVILASCREVRFQNHIPATKIGSPNIMSKEGEADANKTLILTPIPIELKKLPPVETIKIEPPQIIVPIVENPPPPETQSIVYSFANTIEYKNQISLNLDNNLTDKVLQIKHKKIDKVKTYYNYTKNLITDKFSYQNDVREEIFEQQVTPAILDIGIIVDNSVSMKEEQEKLSNGLKSLLSEINDTNWRIAIVTTDPYETDKQAPEVVPTIPTFTNYKPRTADWCVIIDNKLSNYNALFKTNITNAGIQGFAAEASYKKLNDLIKYSSCKNNGNDEAFLRANSSLAVIFITDTDNCMDAGNASQICKDEWRNKNLALDALKSGNRQINVDTRLYGFINDPAKPCTEEEGKAEGESIGIKELIIETAGTNFSNRICRICENEAGYAKILKKISADVREMAEYNLVLNNEVLNSEAIVTVINSKKEEIQLDKSEFIIDKKDITIKTANIKKGDKIRIKYNYIYKDNKEFKLSQNADKNTLFVDVDSVPINIDSYKYDEKNNSIIFNEMPKENSSITIQYKNDVITNVFDTKNYYAKNVKIYDLNNNEINNFKYIEDIGKIEFDNNLVDNFNFILEEDKEVEYRILEHNIAEYLGDSVKWQLLNYDKKEKVAFLVKDNKLHIDNDYANNNDKAILVVPLYDKIKKELILGSYEGISDINLSDNSCSFVSDNNDLNKIIIDCGLHSGKDIVVNYKYLQNFDVFVLENFENISDYSVTVKINSTPITNWILKDNKIILTEKAPLYSTIFVELKK